MKKIFFIFESIAFLAITVGFFGVQEESEHVKTEQTRETLKKVHDE